jgi:hypothetical protein
MWMYIRAIKRSGLKGSDESDEESSFDSSEEESGGDGDDEGDISDGGDEGDISDGGDDGVLGGSSSTTCSSPVGGCETARVSSHTFIAQQVVGNNVA